MPRTRTRSRVSSQIGVPQTPPQGPPDSLDVYFKGPNVLIDPGFENFVQMTGGWNHLDRTAGVNDYVVPYLDLSCPNYFKYPNGCMTEGFPFWAQTSGPYSATGNRLDQAWKISTNVPRSGQYGATWAWWPNDGIPPGELCPINPYLNAPFSARIEPGDTATFSIWVKGIWETDAGPDIFNVGYVSVTLRFYAADFTILRADVGSSISLGSGTSNPWEQTTHTAIAPPGSKYIRACAQFSDTQQGTLFADDAVLAVT